jgi:hypothetical protein
MHHASDDNWTAESCDERSPKNLTLMVALLHHICKSLIPEADTGILGTPTESRKVDRDGFFEELP